VTRALDTARSLARRRGVRVAAVLLPLLGAAGGWLPLLDAPGYELAEGAALLSAVLLAPWLGIAAARAERARPDPSPAAALAGAAAVLLALLAALLGGAALRAAFGPCHALAGAGFLAVLTLPCALLALALAVAAGFAARRIGAAAALHAALVLAALGLALRAAYAGPAAFLSSPLLGAWPGPLYDEAVPLDARLILSGLLALALALSVAAATELACRLARPGGRTRAAAPALLLLAAAGGALGARATLAALGLDGERATVDRVLGGRREGARCTLVLPAEKPEAAASELLAECEFHAADLARLLGIRHPPRVTVYVHRSAEEKRRLVGAAGTDFTKPWLAEIQLTDAPLPHPVLRHELVHALASALADGPLRVPARAGVMVSAGLVEGLAVALEIPAGSWTVHQWSRAARDLGLLPDVARIVGPAGFWAQAPARAYTAAGSFLGFLLERYGAEPVTRAYRTGDLAGALGRPLPALVGEWQAFLGGVTVPEGLRVAARARLSRPSLFARPCVREVAALEAEAAEAAAAGRTARACALYDRDAALTGSAAALKAEGDVRLRAGDLAGARVAYGQALVRVGGDGALRIAIGVAEGDLAWLENDVAGASAAWLAALATQPDRAEARLLQAKLVAAGDPALGPAARPYLLGRGDPAAALLRVARPDRPLSAYLAGRALAVRGEAAAAAAELARAAEGGLPAVLADEARLLLGEARCASGDTAAGRAVLERCLPDAAAAASARIEAALRRCAFEARAGTRPRDD